MVRDEIYRFLRSGSRGSQPSVGVAFSRRGRAAALASFATPSTRERDERRDQKNY